MNNESQKNEFLLFFRGGDWTQGLSQEQIQTAVNKMMEWLGGFSAQGKLKAAQPLEKSGMVVSGKNGRIVKDGPYNESKEIVGGYGLFTVASMEEAVAIAKTCPMLEHGGVVEVRQIAEQCAAMRACAATAEEPLASVAA
jgi:hypothetical protein